MIAGIMVKKRDLEMQAENGNNFGLPLEYTKKSRQVIKAAVDVLGVSLPIAPIKKNPGCKSNC